MKTIKNRIPLEIISTLLPQNLVALTTNPNKNAVHNRTLPALITKIFTFCLMGIFLFTACKKEDEFIPSSGTANLNDPYLKAGSPTFYIDPSGSDAASGDITHPWKTLAYACSQVTTSGNIIYVNAGTYNETKRSNLAVGVSILGAGVSSVINIGAGSNVGIKLDSYGSPVSGNQSISYLKIDGTLTTSVAIINDDRSNVSVHHCTISNFLHGGIKYFSSVGIFATGNSFHDNILTDCGARYGISSVYGHGIEIVRQNGFNLYNCTLNNSGRADNLNGNILTGLWGNKHLKIHDNVFTKTGPNTTGWDFFIELWYLSDEYEVYNNIFNGPSSVDLVDCAKGAGIFGGKVYNNQFLVTTNIVQGYHNENSISIESHGLIEDLYIYDNYFKNCPTAISIETATVTDRFPTMTNRNIYVYKNIIENVGVIGTDGGTWKFGINLSGYGDNDNITWANINIYNNSITAATHVRNRNGINWEIHGTATNAMFRNNIIQGFAQYPISFVKTGNADALTNVSIENNNYYLNRSGNVSYNNGVNITGKTEQNNVTSNPLFVSNSDFHLQVGSPAIDKGINVGLPFNSSAPDLGAFEYSTGGSANQSPQIQNQAFIVTENSPNSTSVGSIVATDPDAGQTLTYSILSGNTNGAFAINASNGTLTVATSSAVNFEVSPTFDLIVKVQDNGAGNLSNQATVTIRQASENVISNGSPLINNQSFNVRRSASNGTVVGNVVASDPNAGQLLTYSITAGNANSAFKINSTNGRITVRNKDKFKYNRVYQLTVNVNDNGTPSLSSQATITVL